jgi:hypothetical protein
MNRKPIVTLLAAAFVSALSSGAYAQATAPDAKPHGYQSFGSLDKDGDGYLSREETRVIVNFDTAFKDADGNKDGRLDPDEYAKAQAIHERVRAGTYASDTWITTKVKAALVKDRDVRASQVNVETFKGVVQLSGFVNNEKHSRRAAEIASKIEGVVEVKNALIVKS